MEQEELDNRLDEVIALNYVSACSTDAEIYADMATIQSNRVYAGSFAYRAIYHCIEGAYHADLNNLYTLREDMLNQLLFMNAERHLFELALMTESQYNFIMNTFGGIRNFKKSTYYDDVNTLMNTLKATDDALIEKQCLKYLDCAYTEMPK